MFEVQYIGEKPNNFHFFLYFSISKCPEIIVGMNAAFITFYHTFVKFVIILLSHMKFSGFFVLFCFVKTKEM